MGVVGATIIACRHEMSRPQPRLASQGPRAGSRLVERIGFIWRRMGF
ncbi:MAG: hypothetical protein ACLTXI_12510 [Collinsella sp.]